MNTLRLSNLEYHYGDGVPVLSGFSLSLRLGERMALVGANGSGKSTTLRMAAGLMTPLAGTVERTVRFGYATGGERGLMWRLTVRQNLDFFGALQGGRVGSVSKILGLATLGDRPVGTLSTGQKARVSLAVAMVHAPPLLILDEVDAGLDSEQLSVLDGILAAHCAGGGSVLLATHRRLLTVDRTVEMDG